jgi:energy-coupling factor transport system permease protein
VLWLSTAALFVLQIAWLAAVLLLAFLCQGVFSGFDWAALGRQARYLLPLSLAVLVVQLLFVKQGQLLWGKGWYAVHTIALQRGLAFAIRILVLWLAARVLLRFEYEDFDIAFGALRLPQELSFMIFFGVRIIPSLNARLRHFLQLLKLRAIELKKLSFAAKMKVYRLISLTILAETLSQSGVKAIALELRGFRSSGPKSRLKQHSFSTWDWLLYASLLALTAFYLFRR